MFEKKVSLRMLSRQKKMIQKQHILPKGSEPIASGATLYFPIPREPAQSPLEIQAVAFKRQAVFRGTDALVLFTNGRLSLTINEVLLLSKNKKTNLIVALRVAHFSPG